MTTTTITSRQEQAELFVIEMDAVEAEIQQTSDWRPGASCQAQLEGLKSDIEALGFQVKRVPTGWALVEPVVEEVAQAASQPTVELHEDEQGLYAEVLASTGKGAYTVRVCARWLYSVSCDCPARGDCRHRLVVDRAFDAVRPTFSEQCRGVVASREVIAQLVGTPDRYAQPLKGSGVTGFRAAEIARKLAA